MGKLGCWFGKEPVGSSTFTYSPTRIEVKEKKKMNKKLLLGILAIALVAIVGTTVVADSWKSKFLGFRLNAGGTQSLYLYKDCWAFFTAEGWTQSVTEGNTYEFSVYVLNTGTELMYITYLPTDVNRDNGQTRFRITVDVINYGLPSQMTDNNIALPTGIASLPYALPEKNVATPTNGFPLMPNKMIKLDISIEVFSVDLNTGTWTFDFEVIGVAV